MQAGFERPLLEEEGVEREEWAKKSDEEEWREAEGVWKEGNWWTLGASGLIAPKSEEITDLTWKWVSEEAI